MEAFSPGCFFPRSFLKSGAEVYVVSRCKLVAALKVQKLLSLCPLNIILDVIVEIKDAVKRPNELYLQPYP